MKVSIVIPAYNEQTRIERTIRTYDSFFAQKKREISLDYELLIVLNGCIDNTLSVVDRVQKECTSVIVIDMAAAGKGLAIRTGFADALTRADNDMIGFVDADMATAPDAFFDLIIQLKDCDGVIASRYMPGAQIFPQRPAYKRWGSRLIYEPFVYCLFGISYYDFQCGAKLFKRTVIATVTSHLTVAQWAFDVELLYLCKKYGFTIKEVPTIWHDQAESKLTLRGGLRMFGALFAVWQKHKKKD